MNNTQPSPEKHEYKINPNLYSNKKDLSELNTDITLKNQWSSENKNKLITIHPPSTVFDVAAYILEKLGPVSTMKLHKLIYYCQAWSLVWDEKPLFHENIEAWANGPVVRDLFNFHRGNFQLKKVEIGNPDKLGKTEKETIDAVLDYYGNRPAQWLIDLTHSEDPWRMAREGLSHMERGNNIITLESMAEYYSSL